MNQPRSVRLEPPALRQVDRRPAQQGNRGIRRLSPLVRQATGPVSFGRQPGVSAQDNTSFATAASLLEHTIHACSSTAPGSRTKSGMTEYCERPCRKPQLCPCGTMDPGDEHRDDILTVVIPGLVPGTHSPSRSSVDGSSTALPQTAALSLPCDGSR